MNSYQKATNALREAFKVALDADVEENTLSEIWRHYLGMKHIAKNLNYATEHSFSLKENSNDDTISYDPDYNIQAAGPVDLGLNTGGDVITFS